MYDIVISQLPIKLSKIITMENIVLVLECKTDYFIGIIDESDIYLLNNSYSTLGDFARF